MNLRDQRKAETSTRLIAAARQSFVELGYADTSMDDLCASAGVTRGALYHNFGGKEGLFEAVVRQIDHEIGEKLIAEAGDDITVEAFTRTCIAYLEMALDPDIQRIMFQDGPSVLGQSLRDLDQEGSLEPLREAIADLQASGQFRAADPLALAVLINGALIDAALWIAAGEGSPERMEQASKAVHVLIGGLAT